MQRRALLRLDVLFPPHAGPPGLTFGAQVARSIPCLRCWAPPPLLQPAPGLREKVLSTNEP
jgi:hypothetical protein